MFGRVVDPTRSLDNPEYRSDLAIQQLPPHRLDELRSFFEDHKNLENKEVAVHDFYGPVEAVDTVRAAMGLYRSNITVQQRCKAAAPRAPVVPVTIRIYHEMAIFGSRSHVFYHLIEMKDVFQNTAWAEQLLSSEEAAYILMKRPKK